MDEKAWQKIYDTIGSVPKNPVIVGFNVNLDRIILVTPDLLNSDLLNQPLLSELRTRLLHSMRTSTAAEWFVADPVLYQQFCHVFDRTGILVMGGQAGISAVHLASTGISDVLCLTHSPGPGTRCLLDHAGVKVLDRCQCEQNSSDTIHLIFEYPPDLVPLADGAIPRHNRFIVSPVHLPESVLIPGERMNSVIAVPFIYTRAFLSGYQYLHTEAEFARAADQILQMKKKNKSMRIHVECVSVTDTEVISGLIHHILPAADSVGLNEHELQLLLTNMNPENQNPGFFEELSPVRQVKGALEICTACGLKRLHLHTYGYYLQVTRTDCACAEASINALLFASLNVAESAHGARKEISPRGIAAYEEVNLVFGPQISPGLFRSGTYTIFLIPTIIAENISKSSGLGDILSSSAFVADRF